MRFAIGCCLVHVLTLGCFVVRAEDVAKSPEFDASAIEFFEREVRPVLIKRCYECHSSDSEEPSGSLRLDSRHAMISGGDTGPAIEPGKPEDSLLIDAINYGEIYEMPPKSKMPPQEIAVLTKWVSMGAPWPKEDAAAASDIKTFDLQARQASHWCWQPIRDPALPPVQHAGWPRKPLDQFILAKLEAAALAPAPQADKRTLIRRAYFDLIGLPPTTDQVDAFLADESPNAFETVIDGLLDSPHFGERWARHWMDLMRYAETYGHEFDYPIPHAHKYRDYLIRAFNADVPYDQFVIEHVAGDLLDSPRLHPQEEFNESVIGTSSWWLGEATHAPVDVLGDEAGRIDNQIDVLSKTFLGLTVACARCHDHKFDAISTKDYYALAGFLQSSRRDEVLLDRHDEVANAARKLQEFQAQGTAVVAQAYSTEQANGDMFARYLLASREVLFGEPLTSPMPQATDEIVFEDFESETYEGWTVEGKAFGSGPQSKATTPSYQGDIGAAGSRWVNSHNMRDAGDVRRGDSYIGTLTSSEFEITRPFIKFLVGGGNHEGKTCVDLVVDGDVVRSQTGFNQNKMRPAQFDVTDLQGKRATIQVVDQMKGGWGNIGVDHIVFSSGGQASRRSVTQVASEFNVDATVLDRWVKALSDESLKLQSHPMYAWAKLAKSSTTQELVDGLTRIAGELKVRHSIDETHPTLTTFESFDEWFTTGHAFGDGPAITNTWDINTTTPAVRRPATADSGRVSKKLQGTLRSPTFTLEHPNVYYRLKGAGVKIRLVLDGYFMNEYSGLLFKGFGFDVDSPGKFTWYNQSQDVRRYLGHRAYIEILDYGNGWIELDEIRFSSEGPPPEPTSAITQAVTSSESKSFEQLAAAFGTQWNATRQAANLPVGVEPVDVADQTELWNWVATNDLLPVNTDVRQSLTDMHRNAQQVHVPSPERVLGLADGTGEDQRIFVRGNHRALGKVAPRQLPEALRSEDSPIRDGSGRLKLATQIVDPKNPLTARVIVNRLWHHMTGRGIVASVDNFGVLGQEPTHPELLDHLATDFMREGWSIKRTLKQIMLSSTYQMSSEPSEEATTRDPKNLLLHRARIRRLQGEAIRDSILSVSGRLDRTMFGPSVPVNITSFMQGRGRPKASGPLDGYGRRSLYIEVRRNFLSPMMLAFDAPIPFNAIGRRSMSNVPAQALIMMNDPFVIEQAKVWAKQLLEDNTTTTDRIRAIYLSAFSRPPSENELSQASAFLIRQGETLGLTAEATANNEQVWADLCHVMMNVKEFIFLK